MERIEPVTEINCVEVGIEETSFNRCNIITPDEKKTVKNVKEIDFKETGDHPSIAMNIKHNSFAFVANEIEGIEARVKDRDEFTKNIEIR